MSKKEDASNVFSPVAGKCALIISRRWTMMSGTDEKLVEAKKRK
jgi:hypothetical protein